MFKAKACLGLGHHMGKDLLWREELQWLNYGSLYLDFKKILARVMYEVQIPRAQNIFTSFTPPHQISPQGREERRG